MGLNLIMQARSDFSNTASAFANDDDDDDNGTRTHIWNVYVFEAFLPFLQVSAYNGIFNLVFELGESH